jgi:hypothetical protein
MTHNDMRRLRLHGMAPALPLGACFYRALVYQAPAERTAADHQCVSVAIRAIWDSCWSRQRSGRRPSRGSSPPLPGVGPYAVLVADGPWAYTKRAGDPTQRGAVPHPTLSSAELAAFTIDGRPVGDLAAENAILWLWVTNAHLPEAFGVVAAWGSGT